MAWDSQQLVPELYEQFGPFSLGIVMAHEIGHAVQARFGLAGPTIVAEQQADCFAGSWTAWAADNSDTFDITSDDLDRAVAGFLQLGDQPGSVSTDPAAHGSAFDRVGAYEDGFFNGAERCAVYATNPPPRSSSRSPARRTSTVAATSRTGRSRRSVVGDLETWWGLVFPQVFGVEWTPVSGAIPYDPDDGPACGGETFAPDEYENAAFYCVPDDYVAWDEVNLMPALYENIGDFAQGEVIANQYSLAVQVRLGITDNTVDVNLQADCFTGTWAASLVPGVRSSLGLEETLDDLTRRPRRGGHRVPRLRRLGRRRGRRHRGQRHRVPAHRRVPRRLPTDGVQHACRGTVTPPRVTHAAAAAARASSHDAPSAMRRRYCMTTRGRLKPRTPTTRSPRR